MATQGEDAGGRRQSSEGELRCLGAADGHRQGLLWGTPCLLAPLPQEDRFSVNTEGSPGLEF